MAVTARLGLRYPVLSDSADVPRDIQNLANDVDGKVPVDSQGVLASRPSSGLISGQYYFATDNNLLYRYNGSAWITINAAAAVDAAAGVGSLRTLGTGALQAAAGNDARFAPGTVDAAAGTGSLRTLGTGALQAAPGNDGRFSQPGDLKETAAINLQSGWLECDGASYLRASFAALFAALGGASSTWGLPDGTHFNVPDFRGRSPMGAGTGAGLTNRVFGTTAGAETVVLTVGQLPPHAHVFQFPGSIPSGDTPNLINAGAGTNVNTGNGNGLNSDPHPNVHPVAIVHIQIKT